MGLLFEEGYKAAAPPIEMAADIEVPPLTPANTRKPRRFALFAFVAMFAAVLLAAVVYLVIRRVSAPPPITESAYRLTIPIPAPPPPPAPVVAAVPGPLAPLAAPQANRMYLQVGSLDKGVAEVLAQGLRIKGIPSTVAPGVSAIVSRIIVGPFETQGEMAVVNKHLTDLGFKPFPRRFEEKELKMLLEPPPAK